MLLQRRFTFRIARPTGIALLLALVGGTMADAQPPHDIRVPLQPERKRSRGAPAPQPPPPLPPEAASVPPLTLDVVTRLEADDGPPRRQKVTRTADRVHVAAGPDREWLYVRNPVDPLRVSATLVAHRSQTLVLYDESDLRNALGIRGWADVLTLGFEMTSLTGLLETSDSRTIDTFTFTRYTTDSPVNGVRQVWWNQSALLPLEVVKGEREAERTVVISIERISGNVTAQLLEPPDRRFPDYRRVDFPDWLEWLGER